MSGLTDSIRQMISAGETADKEQATDNIKQTIELVSKKLLDQAMSGTSELDVKDLKDLASVYTLLQQTSAGDDAQTGAPQAPAGMSDIFNDSIPVYKDPQDENKKRVDQDDLINLSSKDIDKMVSDQFKEQNKLNYKANEA